MIKHTMRIFTLGLIWLVLNGLSLGKLHAENVLKIGSYEVLPNTDLVIQLEAENSSPFTAFQADIPIPEGYRYVDGSAKLNASRISGHALSASLLTGNTLRLIGYSANNTAFLGNAGALVSFTLKSGTMPRTSALELKQPLLGDSQSKNILTRVINGSATVLAPNIKLSATSLNFGRVPLGTVPELTFQITNEGNRDLTISGLNFNDSQFTTTSANTFTISANSNRNLSVKFSPTKKGTLAKELQLISNDPDQPISTLALNAVAYAVNEIHVKTITGASLSTGKLEFSLNNMEEFTGFQFDLNLPQPMTFVKESAQLFRALGHEVVVSEIANQTLRVLAFSPQNKAFTGIDGKLLSLTFSLNGIAGNYPVNISNVIITNTSGENIVSASYPGSLQISSPDIDAPTQLNFGDVSILAEGNQNFRVYNKGQEKLSISRLMFSADCFKSNQVFPVTIQPGSYFDLPIKFAKTTRGITTGTMKIVSDDPDENPLTIQLSANVFVPNSLQLANLYIKQRESKNVSVEIENQEPFVAFQFDLDYPEGFTPDLNAVTLTDRKQDHAVSAIALSKTSLRILVYSLAQKPFKGNSGSVLNIPFKVEPSLLPGTYNLTFSNTVMSNEKSESILYSTKNATLTILDNTTSTQTINFNKGWNIFSANVYPEGIDMKQIFQELIDSGKLIKVLNSRGESLENWGKLGGWKNLIDKLSASEGYRVKVNANCSLKLSGIPIPLPYEISLSAGWNIISFPSNTEAPGTAVMQSLIDNETLIKVQDQNGKTIENWGKLGGWKNSIGNFKPGEGYKVKVKQATKLIIKSSY